MSGKGLLFSGVFVAAVIGPAPGAIESNLLGDEAVVGATDVAARSRSASVDERVAAVLLAGPAAPVQFAARTATPPQARIAALAGPGGAARSAAPRIALPDAPAFPVIPFADPVAPTILLAMDAFADSPGGGSGSGNSAGTEKRVEQLAPGFAGPDARLDLFVAVAPGSLSAPFGFGGGGSGGGGSGRFGPQPRRAPTDEPGLAPLAFNDIETQMFASPSIAAPAPGALALFGLGTLALLRRRARIVSEAGCV